MAISYNKLWKLLINRKMTQADLRKAADTAKNIFKSRGVIIYLI
jgi:DNA-binding Xre family transcriptional regulator